MVDNITCTNNIMKDCFINFSWLPVMVCKRRRETKTVGGGRHATCCATPIDALRRWLRDQGSGRQSSGDVLRDTHRRSSTAVEDLAKWAAGGEDGLQARRAGARGRGVARRQTGGRHSAEWASGVAAAPHDSIPIAARGRTLLLAESWGPRHGFFFAKFCEVVGVLREG
jgi:hypothetical protein